MLLRLASLVGLCLAVSACASPPKTPPPPSAPIETLPAPAFAVPERPDAFAALPEWGAASVVPGLAAFRRSCARMSRRAETADLSNAAPWAGTAGDWAALCESLALTEDETSARLVIENLTVPVEIVSPDGRTRFTGYFEPLIEARYAPDGAFTAQVPGPPGDLVQSSSGPQQRMSNGRIRPYPARADIRPDPSRALGYAHPADVFFLQIQGSGRLRFPDGKTVRAAYFAHNGHPFRSTANWLIERGEITRGQASMQGIRNWMDRASPARVREAMDANPRFVFFQALPEGDRSLGPVGAEGIPLTPYGSMAVDNGLHAYGVPFLVSTTAPGLGGDWSGVLVAQDTGGAIKGAVRGDIYFGTGDEAGQCAGTMNAPGRMWALLPRPVAARLQNVPVAELGFAPVVAAP